MNINADAIMLAAASGELASWPQYGHNDNSTVYGVSCQKYHCGGCPLGIDIGVSSDYFVVVDVSPITCPFCGSRCRSAKMASGDRQHRGRGVITMACNTELYVCGRSVTAYKIGDSCSGVTGGDII